MTKKEFTDGWKHFCGCIDFGRSNLDAEAIRFMNEGPGKVLQTIEQRDDLLAACKRTLGAMSCDELNNGRVFNDELRKEVKEQTQAAIAKCEA